MLPALMAARPAIKYGVLAGGLALLLSSLFSWGYLKGRSDMKEKWDAAIAEQAAESNRQVIQAKTMESQVVQESIAVERAIESKAEQVKKEVVHHARKNPQPLSAAVVSIYDRLISLPNEAGHSVSAPDSGTGTSEVPRGGVAAQTVTGIQDEDGNTIELTTEELAQAAVDFAEKYALMKNAYKGLSDWNDGREAIELRRLTHE